MRKELLIGCGRVRNKLLHTAENPQWEGLVTLDINSDHNPDIVWDLMDMPLPFEDDTFDEIHAYEVLEHTGAQGDYKFFFKQWSEFWRILKPKGMFFATCPEVGSVWALGDPSHTRVVQKENLVFLSQQQYINGVGTTPMSDFRYLYKADFEPAGIHEADGTLRFAVTAIKPSRVAQ